MTVFDCFSFNDELDILEFRISYLNNVVDRFVIAEAPTTFRGVPKPLHLTSNIDRFAPWRAKMDVIVTEALPSDAAPFANQIRQQAALRRALANTAPDDIVLVGDMDEIPFASLVARLPELLDGPARLVQYHAVNYANHRVPGMWTDGTKACRGADLDHPEMGVLLGDPDAKWAPGGQRLIHEAGWHLSYLGGSTTMARKLGTNPHTELDRPLLREGRYLERCLAAGIDLLGESKLEVIHPGDFDDILSRLYSTRPELFSFGIRPGGWRRESLYAYSHLRAQRRLPAWLVRWFDSADSNLLSVLAAPLIPADRLLRQARRRGWREGLERRVRSLRTEGLRGLWTTSSPSGQLGDLGSCDKCDGTGYVFNGYSTRPCETCGASGAHPRPVKAEVSRS